MLQKELNDLFDCGLKIDGVLGSKTLLAFDTLTRPDRAKLELELLFKGVDLMATIFTDRDGFRHPGYVYLRRSDIENLVSRALDLVNMRDYVPIIMGIVDFEAKSVVRKGEKLYRVTSKNGNARGLLQFYAAAWTDARAELLRVSSDLDIGEYKEFVYFPATNILAGIGYVMLSQRVLERKGIEVNAETLYLSHNQGPGFWSTLNPTNFSGQSVKAQALILKYQNLLG